MTQIGELPIGFEFWDFFAPVADISKLEAYLEAVRKCGDSCGARMQGFRSNNAGGVPLGRCLDCTQFMQTGGRQFQAVGPAQHTKAVCAHSKTQ